MIRKGRTDGYRRILSIILSILIVFPTYLFPITNVGPSSPAKAEDDTVAPTVSITSPANNTIVGTAGDTVTITANASDAVGIAKVEFYVDNTLVGESVYAPYSCSWVATGGSHTVFAKAYDAAGNVGTSSSITIKASAEVTVTSPGDGSTVSGMVTNFTGTFSTPLNPGYYTMLYIDGNQVAQYVTSGPSVSINYNWDTTQYANGSTHEIKISGYTATGNVYSYGTSTVTVNNETDTVAPTVSITSPANNTIVGTAGDTVTITANASDAVGIAKVEFYVDNTLVGESVYAPYSCSWVATGGSHTVFAKAYDAAGNVGTSSSITIKASAEVTVTSPGDGSTVSGMVTNFTGTFSTPLNPGYYTMLYIDGNQVAQYVTSGPSVSINYNWDTTQYANGSTHEIKISGYTATGNVYSYGTSTVTVNNSPSDIIPPTVIASPAGGTFTTPIDITLSADEPAAIYYTVDGSEPTVSSFVYSEPISISANTNLKFFGEDLSGNLSEIVEENYIIDTDAPAVTITSPINGASVRGMQNIQVTASDPNGILRTDLYIDDILVGSDTVSNYVYQWNTDFDDEGQHVISAKVYDTVNNVAITSVTVNVDRAVPVISNVKVIRNATNAVVTWDTSEPCDSMVDYGTTSSLGLSSPIDSNLSTHHRVVVLLEPSSGTTGQTFYFRAVSKDGAGNVVNSATTSKLIKMYIGTWLMNGNYRPVDTSTALQTDFIGGEAVAEPYEGKLDSGKVWAKVETDTDRNIYIPTFMGPNIGYSTYDYTNVYAFTYVYSPVSQSADLKLTIDDQAKIWLNENLVFTADGSAGSFTASNVQLNQGWNKLLIKVKNNFGGCGFDAAFAQPGTSIPVYGLLYQLEPNFAEEPDITPPAIYPTIGIDSAGNGQVSWQTTELSPAYMEHGPTTSYGTVISTTNKTVNHLAAINNLGSAENYCFNFTSTDRLGTSSSKEVVYPLIHDAGITLTSATATVSWATYAPADSQIEWGTTTSFGQQNILDSSMVSRHSMVITGLSPNTTYYFRIKSRIDDGTLYTFELKGTTQSTYIRNWLVNGLYSTPDANDLLTMDFLNSEQNVIPYERKPEGDYIWAKVISTYDTINVRNLFPAPLVGEYQYKTMYAHTYVYSPEPQSPYLSMGSDDGIRAWVNGELVWSNDVVRTCTNDQDKVQVLLNPGWNKLLIKVKNMTSSYGFSVRFTDAEGNPLDFKYQLDDPAQFSITPDTVPPNIYNVKTSITEYNKVRVEWCTDEAATSYLEWGKDTNYGSSLSSAILSIKHWYDIGPLEANTTYHLRLAGSDYAVNNFVYDDFTVLTGQGTAPFIKSWLINGTYTNTDSDTRLTVDYLGGESIAKPLDGEGTLAMGKNWKEITSEGDYIDLSGEYGTSPDSVAYAHIYVESITAKSDHYLWLGTTGGANVFVNGTSVFTHVYSREHQFNEDIIPLQLKDGLNTILIKLTPGENGQFGFSARVAMINGNPLGISTFANYQSQGDPEPFFTGYGELVQAYTGLQYGKNNVSIRTSYNLGQSWFQSVQLASDASGPSWAQIGNKKGLFYKKLVDGKWQVAYKVTENDVNSWTDEIILSNSAVSIYNVDATEDPAAKKVYVFYSDDTGILRYRVSSDLVTWTAEQTVPVTLAPNSYPNRYPSFGIEKLRNGNWGLAYIAADDSTYHYSKALFTTSKNLIDWQEPSILMASTLWERPSQVHYYEDDNGNLFAGIQRWKHLSTFNMYSSKSVDGGASWSNPVIVDSDESSWSSEHYDPIGNVKLYYGKNGKIKEAYLLKIYDGPVVEDNVFGFGHNSGEEGFGVNPAIGNYSYQNEDVKIPGIGVPLDFTRSYNSSGAKADGVLGYGWTHNYNLELSVNLNGIINVSTEDGRMDSFLLGPDNNYIPFPGVYDTLIKNADGTWSLKRTNKTTLDFDNEGKITKITDKNGNTLAFTYDSNKRLIKVTEAAGRTLTFDHDSNGHIVKVTDPLNREYIYGYNSGNLTTYTDPGGGTTTYIYDTEHRIIEVKDPRNNRAIKVNYDANGKVASQEDAKGNVTSFGYDLTTRKTTITEGGKTKTQEFDGYFRLVKETDPLGYITTYTYDGLGNRKTITNANGNVTSYDYDLNGNLTRTTDPLGNTSENYYNDDSDLIYRKDPNGNITRFDYDSKGNLLTTHMPSGKDISYTYYANGLPQTVTDANNGTTTFIYDQYGYIEKQTDPLGNSISYTYDAVGRRLSVTDAVYNTTSFTYDNLDNLLTATDPLNRTTVYEYDANGNKIKETNPLGKITTYTYDELNQLTQVIDAAGSITAMEYNADGNLVKVTDALGGITTNTYDDGGRLTYTTDANGHSTAYSYDGNDNLLTMIDALGKSTTFTYDTNDRLSSVTDPLGRTTTYEYDAGGNKTKEIDPLGFSTLFTYDSMNNLVTVRDAAYRVTTYYYDGNSNNTRIVDAEGNVTENEYDKNNRLVKEIRHNIPADQITEYRYDPNDRVIQTIYPGGVTTSNSYDSAGNLISFTDGRGYTTVYEYNALNKVVSVTDAVYNTRTINYDDLGRVSSETDWLGNVTSYEYDKLGRKVKENYPDLSSRTFTFDPVGNLLTETDGEGHITLYTYDELDRPVTVTDAVYGITRYTYDDAGNMISETNALNNITTYRYDGLDRLIETVLPGGTTTTYSYDPAGNLKTATDPNGHTTVYDYDNIDRLIKITDALGNTTQYEYDALGNRTRLIDARGKATRFSYNERNLMVSVTDPLNHTMSYEYDANGNMVKMTDARGSSTLYEFDPLNRMITVTDPLNRARNLAYDANGNQTSVTDAKGQVTGYDYDAMNRVTTITRPDNQTISYTYDKNGARTMMSDPTGDVNYTYDDLNRPVKASYSRNGLDMNYAYDAIGNRTLLTVTRGETVIYSVYYSYDEQNRLTELTDKDGNTFTFGYDSAGNVTEVNYPNGTKATFTYDDVNQVTAINNLKTAGGNIRNYTYTYNPNGYRTQMTVDGAEVIDYDYDDLGQLTGLTDKRGHYDFIYDQVGNRLQMVYTDVNSSVYSMGYTYDIANQLLTAGPNAYTYDANGNRLTKTTVNGTVYYEYDYLDMLTGITSPDGTVTYTYDGDTRKVSRESDTSGVTYFLFDGDTAILEGVSPDLANPTSYVEGLNGLLSKVSPEGIIAYYYYDAQGNLGAMADELGNITDTYGYDAWGALSEHTGNSDEKYTYVGKYGVAIEPDDGLLMMGRRFYDPELGIFLQKDVFPGYIQDPTTLHPYMYTRNDPVNKIDPDGQLWIWDKTKQVVKGAAEKGKRAVRKVVNKGTEVVKAAVETVKGAGQAVVKTGKSIVHKGAEIASSTKRKVKKGIATGKAKVQKKKEQVVQRGKEVLTRGKERAIAAGQAAKRVAINAPAAIWEWRQSNFEKAEQYNIKHAKKMLQLSGINEDDPDYEQSLESHIKLQEAAFNSATYGGGLKVVGNVASKAPGVISKVLQKVRSKGNGGAKILQNKAQGEAFEQVVKQEILQTQDNVVQQITVKTQSGVRTRLDLIGTTKQTGNVVITEAKSSATAPLTPNQRLAFPEIAKTGATVVGKGKTPFTGGTQISPTEVDIIRP